MFIEVEDPSEIDCLFAVLSLGLYTAIEQGCISTEDAEHYLFLPSTLGVLQKAGASEAAVDLAHRALFIDDIKRIVPDALPKTLNEMKSIALSIIQSLPETIENRDTWLDSRPTQITPIKTALHSLMKELESIWPGKEELGEEAVSSRLYQAVYQGFVAFDPEYTLPPEFGLSTAYGNGEVRKALAHFLDHPEVATARTQLQTAEARLKAFQDPYVRWEGIGIDYYFGYHTEQETLVQQTE